MGLSTAFSERNAILIDHNLAAKKTDVTNKISQAEVKFKAGSFSS